MNNIYGDLAPYYDALNADVPYEEMAARLDRAIRETFSRPDICILDLGCGTGNMTIPLARRGYELIGLDLSDDMLTVADSRAREAGVRDRIQFTRQDMTDFSLCGKVDVALCSLDGLNHLLTPAALTACFRRVAEHLTEDGVFYFDLNSRYQFETVYADEVYVLETEGAFCVWQNDYHPSTKRCDFWITLFTETADGRYERRDSRETERYFPLSTVKKCLADAGLVLEHIVGSIDGAPVSETNPKWYCVARKGDRK